MMKKKSNDKISELPESLLHHILSFLPYEAVARTSVLSKEWERAWRTYPVLEFDRCTVFSDIDIDFDFDFDLDKDDLIRRNVLFNRLAETMRNRHCRDMGNMIFLSANALALSKISLDFWSKNVETRRYIELLANFHHFSEVLMLCIDMSEMNAMVPSDVRETTPTPLSNLEVLDFVCYNRPTAFTIAKVVDSLLWFAPHTKTILVDEDEFSFEFTYKKQLIYEGEIVSCCKSLPISCWHHCVEAVKVLFKKGSNKISFTLTGADIWEKVVALCEVWQRMKCT